MRQRLDDLMNNIKGFSIYYFRQKQFLKIIVVKINLRRNKSRKFMNVLKSSFQIHFNQIDRNS